MQWDMLDYIGGMVRGAAARCARCRTPLVAGTEAWVLPVGQADDDILCRWCVRELQEVG